MPDLWTPDYGVQKPPFGAQLNPSHPLAQGLVGAWLFNEGSGNKVNDASGNGNTGTLTNMDPATDWVATSVGGGLDLDGTNDRVDLRNQTWLHRAHTYMVRVTVDALLGTSQYLMVEHQAGDAALGRIMYIAATTGALGWQSVANTSGDLYKTTAAAVAAGGTYTLAFTWDGTALAAGINIYRDGILLGVATSAQTGTPIAAAGTTSIGGRIYDDARNVDGKLQWSMLWSYALSASQVRDVTFDPFAMFAPQPRFWALGQQAPVGYFQSSPDYGLQKPPFGAQVNPSHPLAQGLVGAWLLNECSGNRVNDSSGNGNIGTLTNMDPATDWVPTPYGSGIETDGLDDSILCARNVNYSLNASTVEACGFFLAVSSGGRDALGRVVDQAPHPTLYVDSNNIRWTATIAGTSRDIQASNGVSICNVWIHLCTVWDGASLKFFRNGRLETTDTTYSGALSAPTNTLTFMGRSSAADRCLGGTLGWVRVWNIALPDAMAQSLAADPFAMFAPQPLMWYGAVSGGGTAYTKTLTEVLNVPDTIARALTRSLSDAVGGADTISRAFTHSLDDACGMGDTIVKASARALTEAMGVADSYTRAFGRSLTDSAGLADTIQRGAARIVEDAVGTADLYDRALGRTITVTVGTADVYSRVLTLARTLTDSLNLSDTFTTDYTSEVTGLRDNLVLIDTRDSLILTDLRTVLQAADTRDSLTLL